MIIYKPLENQDIDCIVAMMQDFYTIDNYPIDVAASKKLFEEFLANESLGKAWLIYIDDEVAGYLILTFIFSFEYGGRIIFLDELYISEKARGKGAGKDALGFVRQQSRTLNGKIMYLEVEPHNQRAQELYLKQGFAKHKRNLMIYTNE